MWTVTVLPPLETVAGPEARSGMISVVLFGLNWNSGRWVA